MKKAFFVQRLNDHIQYLDRITKTVKGKDNFTGCDCHCCKLGHWLDTSGEADINQYAPDSTHLYATLVEQHEQFHLVSGQILAFYHQNDEMSAQRAMTEMHKLSQQLVTILLTIDRQSRRLSA